MKSDRPDSGTSSTPRRSNIARGLPSVTEARAARKHAQALPPKIWLWAAVFIGAGLIVWWKIEEGQVQSLRNELMAKQRAVVADLGPRWFPLRDKIERWTTECAGAKEKNLIAQDVLSTWKFRQARGIYLRLGKNAATDPKSIREAAQKSLHDGFTACLLLVPNPSPLDGPACETTQDCERGLHCNEMKHCTTYDQPYNLRLAYKLTQVMTDEWVKDIQQTGKKLTLRGAMATFDAINKYDLPVAIELLQTAKYFLVVVDDPPKPDEEPKPDPDEADAGLQLDQSIPTTPHQAQVCLWRLEDDKLVLSVRRDAAGAVVGPMPPSYQSRTAWQRQANSCALGMAVREAMGDKNLPKLPPR